MRFFTLLTLALLTPGGDAPAKPLIAYQHNAKGWVAFKVMHEGKLQPITYSEVAKDEVVITNVPVLRIDDKDFVFGVSPGGKWIGERTLLKPGADGKKRLGHQQTWAVGDMHVTQVVEIVPSNTGQLDACLVRYVFDNKGKADHKIGLRKLIDTFLVNTDNHVFALPAQKKLIRAQADFKDEAVPDVLLALQHASRKKPGLTVTFSLNPGADMPPPDRVAVTRFATKESEAFGWDFPVRDIGEDAALVLWWNPRVLRGGEQAEVGYGIGLGEVSLDAAPVRK